MKTVSRSKPKWLRKNCTLYNKALHPRKLTHLSAFSVCVRITKASQFKGNLGPLRPFDGARAKCSSSMNDTVVDCKSALLGFFYTVCREANFSLHCDRLALRRTTFRFALSFDPFARKGRLLCVNEIGFASIL